MINPQNQQVQQPSIIKISQMDRTGVQAINFTRHAIGYVLKGVKYLYDGDTRREIKEGEAFFLCSGTHYIEDMPVGGEFEQIMFYYTSAQFNRFLSSLSSKYGVYIKNDHVCEICEHQADVKCQARSIVKDFFNSINFYVREGLLENDPILEKMKMVELVYHIVSSPGCCIKRKIIEYSDASKDNFEQIIYDNVFKDVSLETIAALCHKSLTSFKKEFKEHFFESPHKWFIKQRLIHARLLLISTSNPIIEISNECSFKNVSHFIKLFKGVFGMTPAVYRSKHKNGHQKSRGTTFNRSTEIAPQA